MNEIFLFTLIAFFGMLIQAFVGFAGSLFAIPLFSLFLLPREAVPPYTLVMLFLDLFLLVEARQHIMWKKVNKLLVGGLCGIPLGAYGLAHISTEIIRIVISAVTLIFGVFFLLKVQIRLKENVPTHLSVGFLSGLLGGSISESGPPVVILGLAQGWEKDSFRATLIAYFFFLALAANLSFFVFGLFSEKSIVNFSVAFLPGCLAIWLGILLKNRVSESFFRQSVLAVIILISLIGLVRY